MAEYGPVVDNATEGRFELTVDGATAFVLYRLLKRSIIFVHTESPPELQGRGVGSALVRGSLDIARERGLEVVPMCPFFAGYIRRHPEYHDLLSQENLQRLLAS